MTEAEVRAIEREQRLEIDGVDRGVERYRRFVAETETPDTTPGMRLMDTVLKGLIPAIAAAQEEALAGIQAATERGRGGQDKWWYPILCLEPAKMAVVTARTILSSSRGATATATVYANSVAQAVRSQRQFDLWKDAQFAAERQRKADGEFAVNVYKLMTSRVKKIDRRTAAKWMKKGEAFDKLEWPIDLRVHLGLKLIELLVAHGGGCFIMEMVRNRGKTERVVRLSPLALDYLNVQHAANELTRPWLLPMICPPKPWIEVQATQEAA